MLAIMRSGVREEAISSLLSTAFGRATSAEGRLQVLAAVNQGAHSLGGNKAVEPVTFLSSLIRDASEPAVKVHAAYLYLVTGNTLSPDPRAISSVAEMVGPGLGSYLTPDQVGAHQGSAYYLTSLIGTYYSRFGTASDVSRLQNLPETFPYPKDLSASDMSRLKAMVVQESRRAIDAIRMSAN
jgi:hypothetical protein